jgi:hypothetical protein
MSFPIQLRALVCDPQKGSRKRLHACLSCNPLVEEVTSASSVEHILDLMAAKKINLLFIDPLTLGLAEAAKLIFQIRENFPEVLICLFIQPDEMRRRTAEFYAGERERFGHYFKLNKDLPDGNFEDETYLMVNHCHEAARRLQLLNGRIQLTIHPRFMEHADSTESNTGVLPQSAREKLNPAGMTEPLPAGVFSSSLPGLRSFTRRIFAR